jgi:bidirectional [NiFe] hydrogenase diaphorase subunit
LPKNLLELAEKERQRRQPLQLRCCQAAGCMSGRSQELADRLEAQLRPGEEVLRVGCLGLCSQGPLVAISGPQGDQLLEKVRPEQAEQVLEAARGGECPGLQSGDPLHPFFQKQYKIVLQHSGVVEPERIESYLALGGYRALSKALSEMTPDQVVEALTRSGLRGRGGAGYPTGLKWSLVAKARSETKYIICNGDEGDPGAFMDRAVLESDPHRVLEGMALAAYAVGAQQGYLYVRGEYPLAIRRLQIALTQARKLGLLGSGILDSRFDFRLELRIGAGAYVCGEETALIASIEGQRGLPRPRPPYPPESGLFGQPTLINNVETFANVPSIIDRGGDWFAGLGTERSKGTKVFALAGKVRHTGLVEVPMGTPLRTIVEDMGGGSPGGVLKAVQTGGPSGGCVPAHLLDTPVDYEALQKLGSIMGSGGMIVMDEQDRMPDVARFFVQFSMEESCGKCVPCRAGTVQMHRILERLCQRRGRPDDLAQLEALCDMVGATSLCGLGQNAPNPVLSTLRYFRHEFEEGVNTDER